MRRTLCGTVAMMAVTMQCLTSGSQAAGLAQDTAATDGDIEMIDDSSFVPITTTREVRPIYIQRDERPAMSAHVSTENPVGMAIGQTIVAGVLTACGAGFLLVSTSTGYYQDTQRNLRRMGGGLIAVAVPWGAVATERWIRRGVWARRHAADDR